MCLNEVLLDIPGLRLLRTSVGDVEHFGVFCEQEVIRTGTKFGPFQGRQVSIIEIKHEDDNAHMWEVGRFSYDEQNSKFRPE